MIRQEKMSEIMERIKKQETTIHLTSNQHKLGFQIVLVVQGYVSGDMPLSGLFRGFI